MSSCRLLKVFVVLAFAAQGWTASALGQSLPASVGPQQMLPSGQPTPYPSTAYSSTYSDAATPGVGGQTATPYQSSMAGLVASAPAGTVGASPYAAIPDPAPSAMPYNSGADASMIAQSMDLNTYAERSLVADGGPWTWQVLPTGLLYKTYLAGYHEPRLASQWVHERTHGWYWDAVIGGRVGLIRLGTEGGIWPEGWQLDVEGAAFPRLDLEHDRDLVSCDYRAGIPLTMRQGPWEMKFGYYHLSSHIGDEYLLRFRDFPRINYVRESLLLGLAFYLNPSLRFYAESGYAFYTDGGAEPWEFQFGADFSSPEPTGFRGSPFFAINGHLREENDYSGNLTVQTGWQWRGQNGHLARIGMQYFNGLSEQYQFYNRFEEQIGIGLWYNY